LPGWFLTAWGREVTELLRAEESAARSRGRAALLRFRLATTVDLLRASWQTRQRRTAGLCGDMRLALRLFRRSPAFTCVATLSLAIGVALAATAFSVLDPAFSRPLPFPQADRLLSLSVVTFQGETERTRNPSYAQFLAWQAEAATTTSSVEALVASQRRFYQPEEQGGVEDPFKDLLVQTVSPGFLSLLGARTSLGRLLISDDHRAGARPVAVVSEKLWRQRLGGRPEVVGTDVKISGSLYTVVGVLTPDFHFGSQDADVIRPLIPGTASEPAPGNPVQVIARLRQEATADRLATELGVPLNRDRKPDTRASIALTRPIREVLYGWARTSLGPFAGVAGLLLLLVTANVANLTLVRAGGRRQEMALRTALGAGRARLVRLVLIEAGLLTTAACALGLLMSSWTIGLLTRLNPIGAGGTHPVFGGRTALFGMAVAAVAGVAAALWPGLTVVRRERAGTLRQGSQSTDTPRQRFSQRALVMCQIACALVAAIGAGLLVKTVLRMQSYDPGVETRQLLTAEVDVPQTLRGRLLDELRTIPGVTAAGLAGGAGLSAKDPITVQSETGSVRTAAVGPTDRVAQVSAGYLEALGVPVVKGRLLTQEEIAGRHPVALVNEEAARRWWPGGDEVVGSRLKLGSPDSAAPWLTIVGVLRNTTPLMVRSIADAPSSRVFLPLADTTGSLSLSARTTGDPLAVLPALHERVVALDRRVRILMPSEARANLDWEVSQQRVPTNFVGALATFGLLLAAMGIYGVTTYAVARRLREFGIRKALGASTGHMVVTAGREAAGLAFGGIALGLAAAAALTRMLEAMLFGTSPLDASVFAGASLLILGIVAVATWVPMRTALRVDPMTTLRCE
jgi:predicted permease